MDEKEFWRWAVIAGFVGTLLLAAGDYLHYGSNAYLQKCEAFQPIIKAYDKCLAENNSVYYQCRANYGLVVNSSAVNYSWG